MARRLPAFALPFALLLAAAAAGSSSGAPGPSSAARVVAIQVIVPGQPGAATGILSAPPDSTASGGFAYPGDGSVVSAGSYTASATTKATGAGASATATATVSTVSLFGGEVTAGAVVAMANVSATASGSTGDFSGSGVSGLVALGQEVAATPGTQVSLGDWGYAVAVAQSVAPGTVSGAPSYQEEMTALTVHLTADHGGLPAGSEIRIGHAQSSAVGANPQPPAPPPAPSLTTTAPLKPKPQPTTKPAAAPAKAGAGPQSKAKNPAKAKTKRKRAPLKPPEAVEAGPGGHGLPVLHAPPLSETPKLTAGRYVFPVYGPSSYTDTFGAPRADVSWHHGNDIFAPLGAPILAVADGKVFSVGWNHLGGYRLWLRDRQGNQFYYAHLSAYSPLAVNGRKVRAGAVLGFVGNTGDAVGTPYHLHFEIHPVSLIHLGYDGAVDPTAYLDAWKHLQDVRFAPPGWAGPLGKAKHGVKPAPPPGAFLLQATDISSANGLEPGSLERALAVVAGEGDGALVGFERRAPEGPLPVRTLRAR